MIQLLHLSLTCILLNFGTLLACIYNFVFPNTSTLIFLFLTYVIGWLIFYFFGLTPISCMSSFTLLDDWVLAENRFRYFCFLMPFLFCFAIVGAFSSEEDIDGSIMNALFCCIYVVWPNRICNYAKFLLCFISGLLLLSEEPLEFYS